MEHNKYIKRNNYHWMGTGYFDLIEKSFAESEGRSLIIGCIFSRKQVIFEYHG